MHLSVRPLKISDIPQLVNYWFENSNANLMQMGVDVSKLTCKNEYTNSLRSICETSVENAKHYYMIWLINDEPVGHNALKDIVKNEIAHMHLHMWNSEHRGKGFGAKFFCMAALEFYRIFNLKMILCEPRSANSMPNKMLTRIGFKKWKTYLSTSSELSLTCELNSYIIDSDVAKDFIKIP